MTVAITAPPIPGRRWTDVAGWRSGRFAEQATGTTRSWQHRAHGDRVVSRRRSLAVQRCIVDEGPLRGYAAGSPPSGPEPYPVLLRFAVTLPCLRLPAPGGAVVSPGRKDLCFLSCASFHRHAVSLDAGRHGPDSTTNVTHGSRRTVPPESSGTPLWFADQPECCRRKHRTTSARSGILCR